MQIYYLEPFIVISRLLANLPESWWVFEVETELCYILFRAGFRLDDHLSNSFIPIDLIDQPPHQSKSEVLHLIHNATPRSDTLRQARRPPSDLESALSNDLLTLHSTIPQPGRYRGTHPEGAYTQCRRTRRDIYDAHRDRAMA